MCEKSNYALVINLLFPHGSGHKKAPLCFYLNIIHISPGRGDSFSNIKIPRKQMTFEENRQDIISPNIISLHRLADETLYLYLHCY